MITQTNVTVKRPSLIPVFFLSNLVVIYVVRAADNLSGKFFPGDSPILPNYYPNDFLPWGVFLFVTLGWIIVDFIRSRFNERKYLPLISGIVVYLIMSYINWRLHVFWQDNIDQTEWAYCLSQLIDAWSIAWLVGVFWATNSLLSFRSGKATA